MHAIDPDALGAGQPEGARHVLELVSGLIAAGESFCIETTLAGRTPFRWVKQAQLRGAAVTLIFIGAETVDITRLRVAQRALSGGHDIPDEDQLRRFDRVFDNAIALSALIEDVMLLDNRDRLMHRLLALKSAGVWTTHADPLPAWAQRFLA
jgi:predicted ABC-type ATPase